MFFFFFLQILSWGLKWPNCCLSYQSLFVDFTKNNNDFHGMFWGGCFRFQGNHSFFGTYPFHTKISICRMQLFLKRKQNKTEQKIWDAKSFVRRGVHETTTFDSIGPKRPFLPQNSISISQRFCWTILFCFFFCFSAYVTLPASVTVLFHFSCLFHLCRSAFCMVRASWTRETYINRWIFLFNMSWADLKSKY